MRVQRAASRIIGSSCAAQSLKSASRVVASSGARWTAVQVEAKRCFSETSRVRNSAAAEALKQAQELAAQNMTPEAVAAKMTPEEQKRLSTVRNIGIAVRDSGLLGRWLFGRG